MQRSFDDLGTPLAQVTFCVLDLETTGASPADCKITEVGAIKVRGGECLGTFETLVNPQTEIPFFITVLTGITQSMVVPAPTIAEILPNLLEFARDTVIVGHNVRFDISFLQAALANEGYPRLGNQWVDTCALARRLVRDEVPDCRLSTLSDRMRLPHQPCHRAMADAMATADLLHALLERAGTIGVLGLDDLFELPTIRAHPQVGKLKLTAKLPRAPGVYLFRGLGGRVLYVGKATNLRARVRSYFGGDERRKISQLLRETETIDHIVCSGPLEAAVLEVRLIHRHLPPFNHRSKLWSRYAYLKLTLNEAFPRLSVVRTVKAGDGCLYLGPLSSTGAARQVAEAIESAVPLRRCSARPPGESRGRHRHPPGHVHRRPTGRRHLSLRRHHQPGRLRPARRPGGAGPHRRPGDPVRAARGPHARPGVGRALRGGGRRPRPGIRPGPGPHPPPPPRLPTPGGPGGARRRRRPGRPRRRPPVAERPPRPLRRRPGARRRSRAVDPGSPLPRHLVDEVACVAAWLDAEGRSARLVSCEGPWASALPALPRYEPGRPGR